MRLSQSDKERMFDSFLTKTIILSSRTYFKKQMKTFTRENTILDDTDFSAYIQKFIESENSLSTIEKIDNELGLNTALKSLSAIEQSVIFLLFQEGLSQKDVAKILKVYSKTVSKIKIRAIKKLRNYMLGGNYEK
jgi:RNA polymerase sigma factor (sigma-70 family)